MNGTFHGVPLRNITPVRTISLEGLTLNARHFQSCQWSVRSTGAASEIEWPRPFDSVLPGNRRSSYSVLCGSDRVRDHHRIYGVSVKSSFVLTQNRRPMRPFEAIGTSQFPSDKRRAAAFLHVLRPYSLMLTPNASFHIFESPQLASRLTLPESSLLAGIHPPMLCNLT
jgi:hypothetical protein